MNKTVCDLKPKPLLELGFEHQKGGKYYRSIPTNQAGLVNL
ncbi:hypothetical protein RSK20926_16962 [Roseobacter sp. SK209-2-6]|nr:hypothetical protein RSK20926_16962 [Roseobacter sp. SK209-2-6]